MSHKLSLLTTAFCTVVAGSAFALSADPQQANPIKASLQVVYPFEEIIPGTVMGYQLTLTNTSGAEINDYTASAGLHANSFVYDTLSVMNQPDEFIAGPNSYKWKINNLAPNESIFVEYWVMTNAAPRPSTRYHMHSVAICDDYNSNTANCVQTQKVNYVDTSSQNSHYVGLDNDLKSGAPNEYAAGETISYETRIANGEDYDLFDSKLTVKFPAEDFDLRTLDNIIVSSYYEGNQYNVITRTEEGFTVDLDTIVTHPVHNLVIVSYDINTTYSARGEVTAGVHFSATEVPEKVQHRSVVITEPVGPEPPVHPELPGDVNINLFDIKPIATSGVKGNAAQAKFTWDVSGADDMSDITYQVCQLDVKQPYECSALGKVVDSESLIVPVKGAFDAMTSEYFVLAEKEGLYWRSDALSIDAANIDQLVTYIKASNPGEHDWFSRVTISDDGKTIAVGAPSEASVSGDQNDDSGYHIGAVYVYHFDGINWSQVAYLKPEMRTHLASFGSSLQLDGTGKNLVVGASGDEEYGAAYVYVFNGLDWTLETTLKASNLDSEDYFGRSVSITQDGMMIAVGAALESSNTTGINPKMNNQGAASGAVYIYRFDGVEWVETDFIKASNANKGDQFGTVVSLSADGTSLAVSAIREASNATGVDGNQNNNSMNYAGAVYVFQNDGEWTQTAYIKASNTHKQQFFGTELSLSGDGHTLAVASESQNDNAVHVFNFDGEWAQSGLFISMDAERYLRSVALSHDGHKVVIGSGKNNAYVYQLDGEWNLDTVVKNPNTESSDSFGSNVALSPNGEHLVIGAGGDSSGATGINGDKFDDSVKSSGAIHVY